MPEDLRNAIRSWCYAELATWQTRGVSDVIVREEHERLNETQASTVVVNIRQGSVSISRKPLALAVPPAIEYRSMVYRDFIQAVVSKFRLNIDTSFAFCLEDKASFIT